MFKDIRSDMFLPENNTFKKVFTGAIDVTGEGICEGDIVTLQDSTERYAVLYEKDDFYGFCLWNWETGSFEAPLADYHSEKELRVVDSLYWGKRKLRHK